MLTECLWAKFNKICFQYKMRIISFFMLFNQMILSISEADFDKIYEQSMHSEGTWIFRVMFTFKHRLELLMLETITIDVTDSVINLRFSVENIIGNRSNYIIFISVNQQNQRKHMSYDIGNSVQNVYMLAKSFGQLWKPMRHNLILFRLMPRNLK